MTTVQLTKLSGKPDSHLYEGYRIEGPMVREPAIGQPFLMEGYIRDSNGDRFDWFHTTTVLKIQTRDNGWIITTKNSEWLVRKL